MLQDLAAVDTHPLAATAARYVGLLPLIPLAGFLVNGALSLIPAYKPGPSDPSAAGNGNGHDAAEGSLGPGLYAGKSDSAPFTKNPASGMSGRRPTYRAAVAASGCVPAAARS